MDLYEELPCVILGIDALFIKLARWKREIKRNEIRSRKVVCACTTLCKAIFQTQFHASQSYLYFIKVLDETLVEETS